MLGGAVETNEMWATYSKDAICKSSLFMFEHGCQRLVASFVKLKQVKLAN